MQVNSCVKFLKIQTAFVPDTAGFPQYRTNKFVGKVKIPHTYKEGHMTIPTNKNEASNRNFTLEYHKM